jgi:toxin YoeB
MNKLFTDEAWNDYQYWNETDRKQLKKINDLIKEIDRTPYEGIGKPEALKQNLKGFWSRRIDQEHRVIYKVEEDQIIFISFRYHYSK